MLYLASYGKAKASRICIHHRYPLLSIYSIERSLKKLGVSTKVDATGQTIGKRYARTDEVGIPLGITIDFDTVEKNLVTLREALTTKQVQIPLEEVARVVKDLCNSRQTWDEVLAKYPLYEGENK